MMTLLAALKSTNLLRIITRYGGRKSRKAHYKYKHNYKYIERVNQE